ncbi:hypothetical protein G6553_13205 [Nocardioides sp. IC4_145]|uniref:hypothetical protein n=1 Tax=Nocardioides sp. IC4_145 TaxID=2714037 RepID=UPI0014080042|nr:hypothetical protein [Nocardioides sp. IC4_145]NHC24124.1 hypothetical protein [Nocardioides sp. IC4_145]
MTGAPEPSYTLALEEARRGFDQLAGEVSDVRGRSVSLLGMGGLAASFLGGLTLPQRRFGDGLNVGGDRRVRDSGCA